MKVAVGSFDKQVLDADDASCCLLEDQTRYASDDLRRNTYHHFGTDRLELGFYIKDLPSLPRSLETKSQDDRTGKKTFLEGNQVSLCDLLEVEQELE